MMLRQDDTASASVDNRIIKEFDAFDIAPEMQANSGVADLMPALVLVAIDKDFHKTSSVSAPLADWHPCGCDRNGRSVFGSKRKSFLALTIDDSEPH
jgi:hypothetical protein